MIARKTLGSTALLAAATIAALVVWSSGLFGLWSQGIAFLANNTKDYTDRHGHLVNGSYSLAVELSDLDSNVGKDIYNDGEHRIYVAWLQILRSGEYDIGFRSSGSYSLSGATLVSGVRHEAIDDHSFMSSTTARMTVERDGKSFDAEPSGSCGLNYRDGDCFSFSFALDDGQAGVVELTIADLYKNVWQRK